MKKQSMAEQTLNKQIKSFTVQAEALSNDIKQLLVKRSTICAMIDQLESEVEFLRQARLAASESRKGQEELYNINNAAEDKFQ